MSQNAFAKNGASPGRNTKSTALWTDRFFSGSYTNRNLLRDSASRAEVLYYGPRGDAFTADSLNVEINTRLAPSRRPGSSVWNSNTWNSVNSFYSFRQFSQNTETINLMADQSDAVYNASNNQKINIWSKSQGSGQTYFQSVGNTLFSGNGIQNLKWVLSQNVWKPNTIYSATAADGTLGDFVVDSNGNLQVAVGAFTLLIDTVQITDNVLTLTLDTAQLADPDGVPAASTLNVGGNLPADNWYAVVAGVDAFGDTTEAGGESTAAVTTGSNSSIFWSWTPISGASSYQIYIGNTSGGEGYFFTTTVPSFTQTDVNGTIQTPPVSNSTVVDVPENLYRMTGVQFLLNGLTAATFLNGQTITLTGILPGGQESTQIIANFTHADYGPAADTGTAVDGTGITGSTEPVWSTVLNAVTQDGGAQWINRGSAVENWGLAAPINAPQVSQITPPNPYPSWQGNTVYWRSHFITTLVGGTPFIFQLTTSGQTGSSVPAWNTTTGSTTADGTAVWTCQGTGVWAATTSYTKGSYILGAGLTSNSVFIAQNTGISGANQNAWTNTAIGSIVTDGGVVWRCVGFVAFYQGLGWPFNPAVNVSNTDTILDVNGNLEQIQENPLNGGGQGATATASLSGSAVGSLTVTNGGKGYTQGLVQVIITGPGGSGATAVYTATVSGGVITALPLQFGGSGYSSPPTVKIQAVNTQWISAAIAPSWSTPLGSTTAEELTATITGGEQANSISAILDANPNSFSVGQTVVISGLTVMTYYNGSQIIVDTAANMFPVGTRPPGFIFPFSHGVTSPATDSGTATVTQTGMWLNIGAFIPVSTEAKRYGYAYENSIDDTISDMSPASASITIAGGNVTVVTGLGSPDTQADTIIIYATTQDGATYFELDKIANSGPGVQWSYTDTLGDAGLNVEEEAATDFQNQIPPAGIINLTYHLNRIFGSVGNTVYWSTGPDTPAGNGLNGFSPSNYAIFPSLVKKLVALSTGVLVFTVSDIYIIYGSATANSPLTPYPYALGVGLSQYNALDINGGVVYFFSSDAQLLSLDPNNGLTQVGFPIGDQFELAPWSPSSAYVTWHTSGTRDQALYVADGVGDWFRMNPTPAPETGVLWNPKATIRDTKAVQSVETSPGVHQLLIGPSGNGPILFRDLNTNADNDVPYPSYFTVGALVLAHPGQIAEVGFLTIDSMKIGKPVIPSVLIDEISGPFEQLPRYAADPTELLPSQTVYSNRHYFSQGRTPAVCRYLLLQFRWAVENVPSELFSTTLYGSYSQEN